MRYLLVIALLLALYADAPFVKEDVKNAMWAISMMVSGFSFVILFALWLKAVTAS